MTDEELNALKVEYPVLPDYPPPPGSMAETIRLLIAEVERLHKRQADYDDLHWYASYAGPHISFVEDQVKQLRAALRIYATRDNWQTTAWLGLDESTLCVFVPGNDGWELAVAALEVQRDD